MHIQQTTTNKIAFFDLEHVERLLQEEDTDRQFLFDNASDFSQFIELSALKEDRSCSSIIIEYCEDRDIEADDIAKLVTKPLREKLMLEMQAEGLLRKSSSLDFE